jgi:long-subunit fatty acid transport protein
MAILICVFGLTLAATQAFAGIGSTPYLYGFGARGLAMGTAYAALSGDTSSAYYNPAAMATLADSAMGLTYGYAAPDFDGGPKGDTFTFDHASRVVQFNLAQKLNSLLKSNHDVAFGMNISLDDNGLGFIRFNEVQDPNGQYIRYGSSSFTLNATVGFGVTEWLYLGGGVMTTLHANSQFYVNTDLGGKTSKEGIALDSDVAFSPNAAFFLRFDPVDIGGYYQGKTTGGFNPIVVNADAVVGQSPLASLPMTLYYKDNYIPHRAGLGVLVHAAKWASVTVDTVWYNWGDFDNEVANHDLPHKLVPIDFHDTYVPHLGMEFMPFERFFIRAGYGYESSPVSKGGSSLNMILDNDKHIAGFGLGYDWQEPPLLRRPLSFDVSYFGHFLVSREMESSDGVTYESSGMLNGVAGTLTLRY